ncbi:hypothetical protein C451_00390 [Halococcus thailandensis JCM 13552]|uniref:Uncharacterized protein n=1 Tax=Halococcus thailandensis JCM 13552 TaxID=1227457 RepID=M0NGX2_9EURY|nr:hypothetical protein C451_00390 [Halococcus thailandensis JCM 13552]
MLFDVNDVLDNVSAASFGAFEFALQLVAFVFDFLDARFELLLGTTKLVILSHENMKVLSLLLTSGVEFGVKSLVFGLNGVKTL